MKVHLIKEQTILDFVRKHASSEPGFDKWLELISNADWNQPEDMLIYFNSVDNLGNGSERVVFNIKGNDYRIICKYLFGAKKVHLFVMWIGTHAEYTKLCDKGEQYTVEDY